MPLAKHVNSENLVAQARDHKHHKLTGRQNLGVHTHAYSSRYATGGIPKFKMPSKGVDAESAYQLIHDELELDGQPNLNLASFVHTWMPEQGRRLMTENMFKNLIDQDEYPQTQVIHTRCISMLADLWHAPHSKDALGTATTGSSEAIMLGGLAMKKIWQAKMKKAGKSIHEPGPNVVMGANAQVAIEKFARYFDVECRLVPTSVESHYCMDPKRAMDFVDENTIGIFVILGSTYTGHYEPVLEMSNLLDEYEAKTGIHVPIHVDAASGGFFAPFANPELEWDFKIPRVVSINSSGHKMGLAAVGVGWVIWRSKQYLPKELIFELHYLGSVELSFSLNFSRPAAPIIGQYFNLINLGFEGYRQIALNDLRNARLLSRALERSGYYHVLSDIHRPTSAATGLLAAAQSATGYDEEDVRNYVPGLAVVSFRFSDEFKAENPNVEQKSIQHLLRAKSWIVPNYELAPDLQDVEILRVVVRESMSEDLVDRLVTDIMDITESLRGKDSKQHHIAHPKNPELHAHKLDHEGSKPTGYAKPC